jgi:penicillin-binding protein-related factor A (putative recombinase)
LKFAEYDRIISGLILDFRDKGNTYFLEIRDFKNMIDNCISKKSFNEEDMWQYCQPYKIEKEKLRIHYRYNIESFCNDIKNSILGC